MYVELDGQSTVDFPGYLSFTGNWPLPSCLACPVLYSDGNSNRNVNNHKYPFQYSKASISNRFDIEPDRKRPKPSTCHGKKNKNAICKCFHSSFNQNPNSPVRFRVGSISNQFDIEASPFMIVGIPRKHKVQTIIYIFVKSQLQCIHHTRWTVYQSSNLNNCPGWC